MFQAEKYDTLASYYKILVVSDVHSDFESIDKLIRHMSHNNNHRGEFFDMVFVLGDIANLPNLPCEYSEDQMKQAIDELQLALVTLLNLGPVYFIPGNHDSLEAFTDFRPKSDLIKSVHNRIIKIDENLTIMGFGGSSDTVWCDENGEEHVYWGGYPYSEDVDVTFASNSMLENLKYHASERVLLLTHQGPANSAKTVVTKFQSNSFDLENSEKLPLYTGSVAIQNLTEEISRHNQLLGLLHGHTHCMYGIDSIHANGNEIPVMNPGALKNQRYAAPI
ncbi:hypothetical protein PCE1_003660 [Barthelona sp. PCE]